MLAKEALNNNLEDVLARISAAALRAQRDPAEITLVAVSKKQPFESMLAFMDACNGKGTKVIFGENYVKEYRDKAQHLEGDYAAHLIGPLQRNKAKDAVRLFDVIESVHSIAIAEALNSAAAELGKVQEVFLQVNISGDAAKSGISPEDLVQDYAKPIRSMAALKLCGLMTITAYYAEPEQVRPDYREMVKLRKELEVAAGFPADLSLSMGMSNDFEVAIEEGANLVRVGTALFGPRTNS